MTTTLTAEAVRGMGAGRQLDAPVAEHVMGWRERVELWRRAGVCGTCLRLVA